MSDPQMETVAEALAAGLARHGVTEIFGQSLPSSFFLATPARGIRQIGYRTENAGGVMADGYARVAGRVGVVAAQNGPAATLLVPPLAEASKASVPLLALVQEIPTSGRERNAFQEFDHFALFASCTKWVRRLDDPARVDDYLDQALVRATTGRPGPVVLLLPRDVLEMPAPAARGRSATLGGFPLDRVRPDPDRVREAARLIADAESPVVIAGGGVHLSGAAEALARLQETACLAVGTSTMGKGAVDEAHPLSIGMVGNYMGERGVARYLRDLVTDADVVVLVGTRTNENGTDTWSLIGDQAAVVHLDLDGAEVGRNYEAVRLLGDARLGLEDLCAAMELAGLERRRDAAPALRERIAAARASHRREAAAVTESDSVPLRPERVMAELESVLTDDSIVVADASYSTIWMGNYLRSRKAGQRFLSPRGLAGLGWGLPLALGAKSAAPHSPVVCISGDGGFAHVWSEIETAVREDLPVTMIVLNNRILGFQKHAELIRLGAHTSAVGIGAVDHAAIARACGAEGVRVEDVGELRSALAATAERTVPVLIDVVTDPDAFPPIAAWDGKTSAIRQSSTHEPSTHDTKRFLGAPDEEELSEPVR